MSQRKIWRETPLVKGWPHWEIHQGELAQLFPFLSYRYKSTQVNQFIFPAYHTFYWHTSHSVNQWDKSALIITNVSLFMIFIFVCTWSSFFPSNFLSIFDFLFVVVFWICNLIFWFSIIFICTFVFLLMIHFRLSGYPKNGMRRTVQTMGRQTQVLTAIQ